MASPTSRLLELLELLQTRPLTTGREIADRLGIDARTVRRYIGVLQELGIPVEGQRGVGGGYRIRPGYRLPPLMLGDEEAVVVVLGLLATRGLRTTTARERGRRRAREDQPRAAVDAPPPGRGARGDARLHGHEAARAGRCRCGAAARRRDPSPPPAPHRLPLVLRRGDGARAQPARPRRPLGRWYLAAHDHLRDDLRTFRVDRMSRTALVDGACGRSAGRIRRRRLRDPLARQRAVEWEVEVLLDLPVDEAARRIPATLAELVDDPAGTLLRMRVGSLDWMATVLAGLGCGFTIRRPDELRASVRALAKQLAAQV